MKWFEVVRKEGLLPGIAVAGIAVFGIAAVFSSVFREFNHDEFEAIHSAWKVLSGETIYIDFLQHHHFLLYYGLGPVFMMFGPGIASVVASRLLMLAMAAGIAFLTYRIARLLFDGRVALFAVFFLVTSVTFSTKVIEVRPDVPLVLMELLSVFLLLSYFEAKATWKLVGSSVALFVGFLFLQKAVFLGILLGIWFLYGLWKRKIDRREFFTYWGTFSVLLAGFLVFVSTTFGWSEYYFLNWEINTRLLNTFPLYKYLLRSAEQNPLLWLLFVVGVARAVWKRSGNVALLFGVGLLATIFLTKSPFPQYYLTSMPWIAIVAASALVRLDRVPAWLVSALLLLSLPLAGYFMRDLWDDNRGQLAKVEYVLSITGPDDLVYDGDAQFNLFRKDIDYFWFSVKPKTGVLSSYRLTREYDYDTYRLIGEKQPKVVSDSFIKTKNPAVADRYVKSEAFGDLYVRIGD